ncbi:hypothetical protein ACFSHQ_06615 [Gemmobacter lanyuensis]
MIDVDDPADQRIGQIFERKACARLGRVIGARHDIAERPAGKSGKQRLLHRIETAFHFAAHARLTCDRLHLGDAEIDTGVGEHCRLEGAAIVDEQGLRSSEHRPRGQGTDLINELPLVADNHLQALDGAAGLGVRGENHAEDAAGPVVDSHRQPPTHGADELFELFGVVVAGDHGKEAALHQHGKEVDLHFIHADDLKRAVCLHAILDRTHALHGFLLAVAGNHDTEFVHFSGKLADCFPTGDAQFGFTALRPKLVFLLKGELDVHEDDTDGLALKVEEFVGDGLRHQRHFGNREAAVGVSPIVFTVQEGLLSTFLVGRDPLAQRPGGNCIRPLHPELRPRFHPFASLIGREFCILFGIGHFFD